MKPLFLRHTLLLALCACLAVTFVTGVSPAKSAHAATASAASCPGNLNWGRGKTWLPGQETNWRTCAGTSLQLAYQGDANFVLYIGGHAKWATNTSSPLLTPWKVIFQSDGNLVAYDINAFTTPAVWASHTVGEGTRLSLQEDGNFVIYNASGHAVWASHTCCWR